MDETTNDSVDSMNQQTEKRLRLADALPAFADELRQLLIEKGELDLASKVPTLNIFYRRRCGDDIGCGTFYSLPKPHGSFGLGHRNVRLFPEDGALLILDVVDGEISCVEVLDRPDIRKKLLAALP